MKKLIFLLLILAMGITACSPTAATPPASSTTKTDPAGSSSPLPATPTIEILPTKTSDAPLSESLLITQYVSAQREVTLLPVDSSNGAALAQYPPIALGRNAFYAVAPDRQSLAVLSYPVSDQPRDTSLLTVNIPEWTTTSLDIDLDEWVAVIVYSPDGRYLAVSSSETNSRVFIVDMPAQKVIAQTKTGMVIRKLQFTADSAALMLYGVPGNNHTGLASSDPQVKRLNVPDLSEQWHADLKGLRDGLYQREGATGDLHAPGQSLYLMPGMVFSPNADTLYLVDAEHERLLTVDFAAQTVTEKDIAPQLSWIEQLLMIGASTAYAKVLDGTEKHAAISPDGQSLYVLSVQNEYVQQDNGTWELRNIPHRLQVIRTADGVETTKFETTTNNLTFSTDGSYVYLHGWEYTSNSAIPWTEIMDSRSGKIIARVDNYSLFPTHRLDGKPMIVANEYYPENASVLAIFDHDSRTLLTRWAVKDTGLWVVIP